MKLFIDANVFILALLDSGRTGENARELLDEVVKGKHEGVTSVLVMDEIMWVLIKNGKGGLLETYIKNIYEQPNLYVQAVEADMPLIALEFMREYKLKPRDAMHCAFMKAKEISAIASDDKDFDRVKHFKRVPL